MESSRSSEFAYKGPLRTVDDMIYNKGKLSSIRQSESGEGPLTEKQPLMTSTQRQLGYGTPFARIQDINIFDEESARFVSQFFMTRNPAKIQAIRMLSGQAMIGNSIGVQQMLSEGAIKLTEVGEEPPKGYVVLDEKLTKTMLDLLDDDVKTNYLIKNGVKPEIIDSTMKTMSGNLRNDRIAIVTDKEGAMIFHNMLSMPLEIRSGVGSVLQMARQFNGIALMLRFGLSMFHGATITFQNISAALSTGTPIERAAQLTKIVPDTFKFMSVLRKIRGTPISQWHRVINDPAIEKTMMEYVKRGLLVQPADMGRGFTRTVTNFIWKMHHPEVLTKQGFWNTLYDAATAGLSLPLAATEIVASPIMKNYVPACKMRTFHQFFLAENNWAEMMKPKAQAIVELYTWNRLSDQRKKCQIS